MNRTNDILIRLVFGNVIIKNNIFKFIQGYGKKYEKADFTFILFNKKWELFILKVKSGEVFKDLNLVQVEVLIQQFQKELKDDSRVENTLIKFYECNKHEILKLFSHSYSTTTTPQQPKDISLISFFIGLKCNSLVKLIFKETYSKDNVQIGKMSEYYEQCIKSGNCELLSFLIGEMKIPINNFKDVLYWSLQSSNRDEMVVLLDELGYSLPTEIVSSEKRGHFFIYLVKLDFKLFKKIVDANSLSQQIPLHTVTNISNYSKSNKSNEIPESYTLDGLDCNVPFKKVLDFIQSSIYIMMNKKVVNTSSKGNDKDTVKFNYYFKKIQLLIQFNDEIDKLKKDEIQNQIINLENENSDGGKGSKSSKNSKSSGGGIFKSIFKSSSFSSIPLPQQEKIKFEEFNLEREIRRVYTFDFLNTFKELKKLPTYLNFVINYASNFKEYSCIDGLLQMFDGLTSDEKKEKEKKITSICVGIAFLNADSDLLEYIHEHNRLQFKQMEGNTNSKNTKLFSRSETPVDTQIEFLYKLVRRDLNLSISFVSVLSHVFDNKNLTIKELDSISDVIETYFKKKESSKQRNIKYLDVQIIIGNNLVLDYFISKDTNIKRYFSN